MESSACSARAPIQRCHAREDAYSNEKTEGHHRAIAATVGLGVAALPADAALHSVTVVLVTGERINVTVDVPPGTPVSQVKIPGITGAIAQVIDNGPIQVPGRRRRRRRSRSRPSRPCRTPPTSPARPSRAPRRPRAASPSLAPAASPTSRRRFRRRARGRPRSATRSCAPATSTARSSCCSSSASCARRSAAPPRRARSRRHADHEQPDLLAGRARRRPDRRPKLLHLQVPDPALPAPALPGRRHRVRRAPGGPRRHQRDRDRLRPQPQRVLRGRARWMQFMPATWRQYGVDANKDDLKDPYNPADVSKLLRHSVRRFLR